MRARIGRRVRWAAASRSRGQMLVLLAVTMVAMIGVLGLATDLGYLFVQKRAMQNAADAAALAAAQQLTKWDATNDPTPVTKSGLQALVDGNALHAGQATITTCQYVDKNSAALGDCGGSPPASAAGVEIALKETHPTFFIRIIPGGPKSASTSATATARVYSVTNGPSDGPFIVCGVGEAKPILRADNTINPNANNVTYVIHASQVNDCGAEPSDQFKGLANQDANAGKGIGDWWANTNGVDAGPTSFAVNGIDGCKKGTSGTFGCVLILPIATDNPAPRKTPPTFQFNVVAFGAFYVTGCSRPCQHQATLLANYVIGPGNDWAATTTTWQRGKSGLLIVRLVPTPPR